jgi:hypothetical protein
VPPTSTFTAVPPTNTTEPTATAVPPTATPVPPTPTALPTAAAGSDGPLVILKAQPWPQPNPRWLGLKLDGSADRVHCQIYSQAWVEVEAADLLNAGAGWNRLSLEKSAAELPNGTYYYSIQARRGGVVSKAVKGILYRER